jgi:tetratricopeptide (TPR) repeat protein
VLNERHIGLAAVSARRHLLSFLLLGIGTVLIYGRVAGFGYAGFDDVHYVLENAVVRGGLTLEGVRWAFTEVHLGNWHPLTTLSNMLDVTLFGLAPGPQHVVNVVLHLANSILLYGLALLVLRHWGASLVVAWLFMAHPLRVESVAWIAERKDVLCAFFFLLSLLAYLWHRRSPSPGRYGVVAVCFVLALLSKPMAVTLPVVLLLLDWWPLDRFACAAAVGLKHRIRVALALVTEKLPLFLLALASSAVTLVAQATNIATLEAVPFHQRAMNAVVAYAIYLRDMLMPTRLAAIYPHVEIDLLTQFLPALVVIGGVSVAVFAGRRRFPWLVTGWLWYLVMLVPVIGLVQVGTQSHADRYTYLPSIGLLLALGAALAGMRAERLRTALLGLAPVMLFYAAIAWVQVGYWSDPYMIFTRVIDVVGDNYPSRVNLAAHMLTNGQEEEAEAHARRAIELQPGLPYGHAVLGLVHVSRRMFREAELSLREALLRSPDDAGVLMNLGYSVEMQGRKVEARSYYEAALARNPALHGLRENLERVTE